ncbi:MAG: hypothetical protein OCD76_03860 [Reichenbachiella sp.]
MTLLSKIKRLASHKSRIPVIALAIGLHACSPALVSWTSPSYEPHEFKKIIVFGMFKRLDQRIAFEEAIVDQLLALGYPAGHGMTLIPPSYQVSSQEDMERIIKKENFDMVIMASAVDSKTETNYHSNNTGAYGPGYGAYGGGYGMYNYYNHRYGYGVGYGGYGYGYSDPGYYSQSTTLLIECQIYDLSKEATEQSAVIYTGQSQITESSNMSTTTKRYANILLKDLNKNKIIK